jgi:intracellular sulfur oxidation DsrE/DsrF family protein
VARHVVSVISGPAQALGTREPVLEANAFAVAEDVDLQLVLRGAGVELAVAHSSGGPTELVGTLLGAQAPSQDLRALIESGVAVHVDADGLTAHGLHVEDLVPGAHPVASDDVNELLRTADAVLIW